MKKNILISLFIAIITFSASTLYSNNNSLPWYSMLPVSQIPQGLHNLYEKDSKFKSVTDSAQQLAYEGFQIQAHQRFQNNSPEKTKNLLNRHKEYYWDFETETFHSPWGSVSYTEFDFVQMRELTTKNGKLAHLFPQNLPPIITGIGQLPAFQIIEHPTYCSYNNDILQCNFAKFYGGQAYAYLFNSSIRFTHADVMARKRVLFNTESFKIEGLLDIIYKGPMKSIADVQDKLYLIMKEKLPSLYQGVDNSLSKEGQTIRRGLAYAFQGLLSYFYIIKETVKNPPPPEIQAPLNNISENRGLIFTYIYPTKFIYNNFINFVTKTFEKQIRNVVTYMAKKSSTINVDKLTHSIVDPLEKTIQGLFGFNEQANLIEVKSEITYKGKKLEEILELLDQDLTKALNIPLEEINKSLEQLKAVADLG